MKNDPRLDSLYYKELVKSNKALVRLSWKNRLLKHKVHQLEKEIKDAQLVIELNKPEPSFTRKVLKLFHASGTTGLPF